MDLNQNVPHSKCASTVCCPSFLPKVVNVSMSVLTTWKLGLDYLKCFCKLGVWHRPPGLFQMTTVVVCVQNL